VSGITVRTLVGLTTAPVRHQSLAEATLVGGQATERHYHAQSEEIYYVVEGSGEMAPDGEAQQVGAGGAGPRPPAARWGGAARCSPRRVHGPRSPRPPRAFASSAAARPPTVTRTRSSTSRPQV